MFGYPKRDGFLFSFKSVTLLDGVELWTGLTSVQVKGTVDGRDPFYGQGSKAIGFPRGNLKVEMELKFHGEGFFDWQQAHPSFLTESFDDLTLAIEEGPKRAMIVIVGPTLTGGELESEGTDPMEFTLPGLALDILMGNNRRSIFEGSHQDAADLFASFSASVEIGF